MKPKPQVRFTRKPDNPDELLLITVEDGTNTTVFEPDKALYIYHELGAVLRTFGLIEPSGNGHKKHN